MLTTYTVMTEADGAPVVDGVITLREAVMAASRDTAVGDAPAGTGDDIIDFTFDSFSLGVQLTEGALQFDGPGSLTVRGNGTLEVNAGDASRVIDFSGDGRLSIVQTTLRGGMAPTRTDFSQPPENGGAIRSTGGGLLDVQLSTVFGTAPDGNGGAISSNGGTLLLRGSQFSGRADSGGAIFASNADITMRRSDIATSTAENSGGGLYSEGGNVLVADSQIGATDGEGNTAINGGGGGIAFANGRLIVRDSEIVGNAAIEGGGGIAVIDGSSLQVLDSRIEGNAAPAGNGGGIDAAGTVNLLRTEVVANAAVTGGGLAFESGLIRDSTIEGNTATNRGGGLAAGRLRGDSGPVGRVLIANTDITNNEATTDDVGVTTSGGGVSLSTRTAKLSGVRITGNSADEGGGLAIPERRDVDPLNPGLRTLLEDVLIANNTARGRAGGLLNFGRTIVRNTTPANSITGNEAGTQGGGLVNGFSSVGPAARLRLERVVVDQNTAADGGGLFAEAGTLTSLGPATTILDNTPDDTSGPGAVV